MDNRVTDFLIWHTVYGEVQIKSVFKF